MIDKKRHHFYVFMRFIMSSTRINITLDDDLKNQASAFKGKLSGVEQGLLDYINGDVAKMTSEEFLNELERDILNARN